MNFVGGAFYATRSGRKAQRVASSDEDEFLAFLIFWDGYTAVELCDQEGRYLGKTFEHDLDIVGPWDESIRPRPWVMF